MFNTQGNLFLRWSTLWLLIFLIILVAFLIFIDADREKLAASNGKFAQYLCNILDVYYAYHHDAYKTKGLLELGRW